MGESFKQPSQYGVGITELWCKSGLKSNPSSAFPTQWPVSRDDNCKSIRNLVNFKWEKASSKCFIILSSHCYDMLGATDGYQSMYCLPRLNCIYNVRFSWEITKPLVVPRLKCLIMLPTTSLHTQKGKEIYKHTQRSKHWMFAKDEDLMNGAYQLVFFLSFLEGGGWWFWPYHMACRDLTSLTRDQTWAPEVKKPHPNHCTTREFPTCVFLKLQHHLPPSTACWGMCASKEVKMAAPNCLKQGGCHSTLSLSKKSNSVIQNVSHGEAKTILYSSKVNKDVDKLSHAEN